MRAIIVGGGIMGLCTAWALCRSGHDVVLYEQGPIPNPLASSYDEHRLTRFTYGAMTGYARMVHEAHAAWDRLWADLGQSHFQPTGTLVVARDEDGWVALTASVSRPWRCRRDLVPGRARRPPAVPPVRRRLRFALFTPTGGVLFAERILEGLRRWLMQRGARLHPEVAVTDVDTERLAVRTADGRTDAAMRWWSRRPLDAAAPAGAARPRHAVAPGRAVPRAAPGPAGGLAGGARGSRPVRGGARRLLRRPARGWHPPQGRRSRLHAARRAGCGARADRGRPHADDDGGAQPAGRLRALSSALRPGPASTASPRTSGSSSSRWDARWCSPASPVTASSSAR